MKKRTLTIVLMLALALAAGSGVALSEDPSPAGGQIVQATVSSAIGFQGRLVHPLTGMPLSGTYDVEFTFWSLETGGGQIGLTQTKNSQAISSGLYSTQVPVDPIGVDGRELWLQLRVRLTGGATWESLVPRIQVLPTAYAVSLRPGANIYGAVDSPDAIVAATSTSSGFGLRGESRDQGGFGVYGYNGSASGPVWGGGVVGSVYATGYGVVGKTDSGNGVGVLGSTSNGYGVLGISTGTASARGYGGYFVSTQGVGAYGYSDAPVSASNRYTPGLYGKSAQGAGVLGASQGSGNWAYGGIFLSEGYRGLYAKAYGSYYDAYFAGTGGIWSQGGYDQPTASRTLAANADTLSLEPGDVVAIAGVSGEDGPGAQPLLAVRRAAGPSDTAIVGVMVMAARVEPAAEDGGSDVQAVGGSAAPGGYLFIVTQGLVPAVKVDQLAAAGLQVGDLVGASSTAGSVAPAAERLPDGRIAYSEGAVLGKVAGPVDAARGTVPVFVTLR